jgi:hypothetical protein
MAKPNKSMGTKAHGEQAMDLPRFGGQFIVLVS